MPCSLMSPPSDQAATAAFLSGKSQADRTEAFEGVRVLMDYLKTDAPFWKKEVGPDGERWIEPTEDDYARRAQAERNPYE